jgi:hypothetical protein
MKRNETLPLRFLTQFVARAHIPRRKATLDSSCRQEDEMSQSTEKNKALVLAAFDTLFNKRDYAAAEHFWSPNYIQHSAHIEPGREGLFNLFKASTAFPWFESYQAASASL